MAGKKNAHGVDEETIKEYKKKGMKVGERFWPHHAYRELYAALITLGGIILTASILPGDPVLHVGPPTAQTPEILPDWFLMWVYGPLKTFNMVSLSFIWDPLRQKFIMGIVFPAIVFLGLALIPFVDRKPESEHPLTDMYERPKKNATGFAILGFLTFCVFAGLINWPEPMYGLDFTAPMWQPLFMGLMLIGPVVVWVVAYAVLKFLGPRRMEG